MAGEPICGATDEWDGYRYRCQREAGHPPPHTAPEPLAGSDVAWVERDATPGEIELMRLCRSASRYPKR